MVRFKRALVVAMLAWAVSGTADEVDPWEGMNRRVHAFNDTADRWVLKPVAKAYRVLPGGIRTGVSNFFANLQSPVVILNQFLQGKARNGFADTGRFLVNSSIGIGGIFDPATGMGLERHQEDFAQTFARWGASQGPYVVLPLWGPSTIRGTAGTIVDSFAFPPHWLSSSDARIATDVVWAIDRRAALLGAEAFIGGDEYLFFRDAYLQRRQFLINDGVVESDPFLDDF